MHRRHLTGAAALSATALLATSGLALAQEEATSSPSPEGQTDGAQAHPLHIHSGTCEQLGDIVFPLGEISTDLMVHGEAAGGDAMGGIEDQNVAVNVTLVAATLDDLTGERHALNIHQSEEDLATTVACGDIGGTIIEDNALVIRLDEASDSGYVGVVLFQEAEDGNTTVYTMLTQKDAMVESPAMEEPMAEGEEPMAEGEEPMAEGEEPMAEGEGEMASPSPEGETDVTVEVTVDDDADADVTVETPEPEE